MEEELVTLLKEIGLNETEARIYIFLVRKDLLTAYQISKELGIHRSNSYNLLEKLKQKGFVKETAKNNIKYYSTKDLANVIGKIKNTEALILELKNKIKHMEKQNSTKIDHLQTKGAFAQFDTNIYYLAKNKKLNFIYMISNSQELTTKSSNILIKRLLEEWRKEQVTSQIDSRAIWDEKFRSKKFIKQFGKVGTNKFLPKLKNKVTTFIYDNHVSFVFLENNEEVVEISNELISNEMKTYFEYLWSIAKK